MCKSWHIWSVFLVAADLINAPAGSDLQVCVIQPTSDKKCIPFFLYFTHYINLWIVINHILVWTKSLQKAGTTQAQRRKPDTSNHIFQICDPGTWFPLWSSWWQSVFRSSLQTCGVTEFTLLVPSVVLTSENLISDATVSWRIFEHFS